MLSRSLVTGLAGCLLVGCLSVPAVAQLSEADFEALRARAAAEGWTFDVGPSRATSYPRELLCTAVEPPGWKEKAQWDSCTPRDELPESWNWWFVAGSDIRDQGPCGSCWAFGAMGAVECAIRVANQEFDLWDLDLSEQWLVSCTDAGSCGGGWHTESFEYMRRDGWRDAQGDRGAVLEADFEYKAMDLWCPERFMHPVGLASWTAVGAPDSIPSVEQIKQAILDHGPVATCVYVNDAFHAYQGGVFQYACEDEWINHVVTIIGWDDEPPGFWRVRNSWGVDWGEGGYIRIAYNCSQIGYATCYVTLPEDDCDSDGVHDYMQIVFGTAEDCNRNQIPDDCDLEFGPSTDMNENGIPDECDLFPGDMNCDGTVDEADIDGFVLALLDGFSYRDQYLCNPYNADCNGDESLDFFDIDGFVALLVEQDASLTAPAEQEDEQIQATDDAEVAGR